MVQKKIKIKTLKCIKTIQLIVDVKPYKNIHHYD